jgi:hypothetical protein
MGQRLHDAHHQLSVAQAAIDRLKTQLENEKLGNIQLVHWKANNSKVIDGLLLQRAEFAGTGDMNIDALVRRLEPAQAQLEELDEFSAEFNARVEEEVRKPLRAIEEKRTGISGAKKEAALAATMGGSTDAALWETEARIGRWKQAKEEHEQLKKQNEELKNKIEALEQEKRGKAIAVRAFMEETLKTRVPTLRAKTRLARKITRPLVQGRAASRI